MLTTLLMYVVTQMIPQEILDLLLLINIDQLNNTNSLSADEIDNLLLQKERFWISTLVTIHKGLTTAHDWNKKRTERPKQR